jgi:hypothetical protein
MRRSTHFSSGVKMGVSAPLLRAHLPQKSKSRAANQGFAQNPGKRSDLLQISREFTRIETNLEQISHKRSRKYLIETVSAARV